MAKDRRSVRRRMPDGQLFDPLGDARRDRRRDGHDVERAVESDNLGWSRRDDSETSFGPDGLSVNDADLLH
ncbi:MAG: hypothetical protein V1723_02185 [Candidatus Uhrbacteria bacterium]